MRLSRVNTVNCVNSQSAVVRCALLVEGLSISTSQRGKIDQMTIQMRSYIVHRHTCILCCFIDQSIKYQFWMTGQIVEFS